MRLDPGTRGLFEKLIKKGLTVTRVAELFDTTRQTVHQGLKHAKHVGREYFKDKTRAPKAGKVTDEVEIPIPALRNTFNWGAARIQQVLLRLPSFILETVRCQQNVRLSRESINNVLARHSVNGYPHDYKRWRFFRAEAPDELWQIDPKWPFTVRGKKH